MTSENQAFLLALLSAACFSSASLIFADLSRRLSPIWMNTFKALMAGAFFGAVVLVGGTWATLSGPMLALLLFSGLLGLGLGDVFLLTAYARMGSARTLILYGFQPLFVGVGAHFLFHQDLTWARALAVIFFLACLFTFSLEKFRAHGHWEILGLAAAMLGVLFDNTGLLIARYTFDAYPAMTPVQANFIRCGGALIFFAALGVFGRVRLAEGWRTLAPRERGLAIGSSFLGTFISLCLYMTAIKIGQLASLAALGAAAPILSSGFECLYLKKAPSAYLLIALTFFAGGFLVLTWN